MNIQKRVLLTSVLLLMVLACRVPGLVDEATPPNLGILQTLEVKPTTGYGQFLATLTYVEGNDMSAVTCTYSKKDDVNSFPVIIGELILKPGSGVKVVTMRFSETRPAKYEAFCFGNGQGIIAGFTVGSPYVGQYECEGCFSEAWATDVVALAEAPRSMGRNLVKITIDENGNVSAGYIFFEIYGTPPNFCVITRHTFESEKAVGSVNPDTKELIVDFIGNKETVERGGGDQCDPPKTGQGEGATRNFFQFNEDGNLLLCKSFETGQNCIDTPIAVLLKQ